jgi:hypothetical protein
MYICKDKKARGTMLAIGGKCGGRRWLFMFIHRLITAVNCLKMNRIKIKEEAAPRGLLFSVFFYWLFVYITLLFDVIRPISVMHISALCELGMHTK